MKNAKVMTCILLLALSEPANAQIESKILNGITDCMGTAINYCCFGLLGLTGCSKSEGQELEPVGSLELVAKTMNVSSSVNFRSNGSTTPFLAQFLTQMLGVNVTRMNVRTTTTGIAFTNDLSNPFGAANPSVDTFTTNFSFSSIDVLNSSMPINLQFSLRRNFSTPQKAYVKRVFVNSIAKFADSVIYVIQNHVKENIKIAVVGSSNGGLAQEVLQLEPSEVAVNCYFNQSMFNQRYAINENDRAVDLLNPHKSDLSVSIADYLTCTSEIFFDL